MLMPISDLDLYLRKITISEKQHIESGSDTLSNRYKEIEKTKVNNEVVYKFSYNKFLRTESIGIIKETRWTSVPKHVHSVIELIYIYSGTSVQYVNGKKINLKKGDLCLLDEAVLHSVNYLNKNDIVISIVMRKEYLFNILLSNIAKDSIISEFLANAISKETTHNKFLIFKNISEDSCQILAKILSEYFNKTICSNQVINACMVLLMSNLIRQYRTTMKKSLSQSGVSTDDLLMYIEENYQTITLKKMANHFSFSPNYLSYLVKRETGMTFKDLVIKEKFYRASVLLQNTKLPIYQISQYIGYNNLGFFYKKFKSIFNVSPQEYRIQKKL